MFGPSPSPQRDGSNKSALAHGVASPTGFLVRSSTERRKKPRPTNQILMFMAAPPSSRHEDENPDISDENLMGVDQRGVDGVLALLEAG
jgi:hypothetical protein